jgi:hypothetical protein
MLFSEIIVDNPIILWRVEPLVGDEREISSYTRGIAK